MPASKIDDSIRKFTHEPVLCWCNGQSQEARYSPSTGAGGGQAAGRAIGSLVLRRELDRARPASAVRMPRYPLVAVTGRDVLVFDGPIAKANPVAVLRRDRLDVRLRGGPMWQRLDLIAQDGDSSRSYTIMFLRLLGNKRLKAVLAELAKAPSG